MLLRAIHQISAGHGRRFLPGDIFTLPDAEAERLLRLGAAEPARKTVSVEIDLTNTPAPTSEIDHARGDL